MTLLTFYASSHDYEVIRYMKAIFRILTLSCLLAFESVYAQELSDIQKSQLNEDALRAFEKYDSCCSLNSSVSLMDFDLLFKDMKVQIFNDLNGLSADPTLSVEKYAYTLRTRGRDAKVIIRNLKKGQPYYEDGEWKVVYSFDKEISYTNPCQIQFSSRQYFGEDFHLQMTLAWNEKLRSCVITRLDGQKGSDVEMLPASYSILNDDDPRYHKLTINGAPLNWNPYGQAFLPANPQFEYPDPEVRVKVNVENPHCKLISVNYEPKRWRVKAHMDHCLSDFYKGDGNVWLYSSGNEFSVEAGYYFQMKKHIRWGAFAGLGFSKSKLDMNRERIDYNYPTEGEADNPQDSYVRFYDISNIYQSYKSVDAVLPMYIDMDYRFNKYLSFYADAGFKVYLNLKNEVVWNSGTYSAWGYYSQYGYEIRGNESSINGFVNDRQITDQDIDSDYGFKTLSIDYFGRAGARFLLWRNIFLDAGLSFQKSLLSPFNADPSMNNLANGATTSYDALMSYNAGEGENMHSLLNGLSSLRRQSFLLNIGLMYRF